MNEKLTSIKATVKSGSEELTFDDKTVGYSLLDFWKWSVSDILSNATRGRFAEFIVGTSLDLKIENIRNEWDAFDLVTDDGIKIEVKSASYIQSWNQKDYSTISFSIKPAKFWDSENNMQSVESKRHADVYVFCLLKHKDQETINPLKLEQWEFYVLPTIKLDAYERSQSSITLNSLKKLTDAITYNELKENIYKTKSNSQSTSSISLHHKSQST
jgi:hypothetical protein